MRLFYTERFRRSHGEAPSAVRRALAKQLRFLETDLRHPSLRAKKYDTGSDVWQARVDRDWRLYFQIRDDAYILLDVMRHPK